MSETITTLSDDKLLTADEAAEILQVTAETVRLWARKGLIPSRRLGRTWRFERAKLLGSDPPHEAA